MVRLLILFCRRQFGGANQVGVTLLLASMMQIAIKMWIYNEMNRNATAREIKRLELAIVKLQGDKE